MKAVAMVSVGRVSVVDGWPEPRCEPDGVVVAVRGTGVCGSDLAVVQGERPVPVLPWILGHEAFGDIVAVGGDVSDRKVGERVVIEPNYPCLRCDRCLAGVTSGCRDRRVPGILEPGLLAERVSVPARFAWPVPEDWPDADLACIEPLTVALGAVRRSGAGPGGRCLVLGAGSQGLLVCLALLRVGAVPFITDPHPGRVRLARRIGAQDATGMDGTRFPVVFDTAGSPRAFESALDRTESGGYLVVVGQSAHPARIATSTLVQRRLTIRGCLIYDHPGGFARTLAELDEGRLRPGRVVGARFELSQAPRAFAQATRIAGKSWISLERPEEVAL